jgi:hypothetical protein
MTAGQVEEFAQRIWGRWLNGGDTGRLAKQFGYSPNEYGYYVALDEVDWKDLADNVKDHIRDMAKEEILLTETVPQTETVKYLNAMFRELERLWPVTYAATSHGIAWDYNRERLVLLVVLGDCVFPYFVRPDDLTNDPIVTAAHLAATVRARLDKELPEDDDRLITYKH